MKYYCLSSPNYVRDESFNEEAQRIAAKTNGKLHLGEVMYFHGTSGSYLVTGLQPWTPMGESEEGILVDLTYIPKNEPRSVYINLGNAEGLKKMKQFEFCPNVGEVIRCDGYHFQVTQAEHLHNGTVILHGNRKPFLWH